MVPLDDTLLIRKAVGYTIEQRIKDKLAVLLHKVVDVAEDTTGSSQLSVA